MEIAVLGGGHGAYATAADLSEKGHNVRLWRRDTAALQPLMQTSAIEIKDIHGTRSVSLAKVSTNMREIIANAKLIIIPLPATAQLPIAKEMAPYLEDDQIIFLPPGTFGSYVMLKEIRNNGCLANVIFAETGTLPYLARKYSETTVSISGRATRLPTGILPSTRSDYAFTILQSVFPSVEPIQDALDGALMNAGPIIHPPLILMNAAPIEHFDKWDIHNEGTQPSVRLVHDALDQERIAIREALGYHEPHFPLADHYSLDGEEWMYGNGAHEKLVDGADWFEKLDLHKHRYMTEDIACGLAFLVSVAEWAQVKAPVATGLLALASAITGDNLRESGRTLENLNLAHLSKVQLKNLLEEGMNSYHGSQK